jgi:sulfur carrier protein ThiS
MVEVKLHPLLAKRAASRQEMRSVDFRLGLTPMAILSDEGFSALDAEAVMILRNDAQIDPDTPLNDGDRVEFMVGIQGGSGACRCAPCS